MRQRRVRARPELQGVAPPAPRTVERAAERRAPDAASAPLAELQAALGNARFGQLIREGDAGVVSLVGTARRADPPAVNRRYAAGVPNLISRDLFDDENPQEKLSEAGQKRWDDLADELKTLVFDMGAAQVASGRSSPRRTQWFNYFSGPLLRQLAEVDVEWKLEQVEQLYRIAEKRVFDESIAAGEAWAALEEEYEAEQGNLAGDKDPVSVEALKYLTETYEEVKKRVVPAIHFLTEDDYNQLKFVLDNDQHISLGELRGARVRVDALIEMLDVVEELRYEGKDEDHILPGWDDAVYAERDELQRLFDNAPDQNSAGNYQRLQKDLMEKRSRALDAKPREKGVAEKAFLLGKGAVSSVVGPVVEAGKQLVDLGQIGAHYLSFGKYEPKFISDMADAAEKGATTGDLLKGMAVGLIETPERFLKAVEAGDWEAIGRETTNLYMLAKAGKAGSGKAAKMLRWAKARQLATRAMRNGGEGATINFSKQLAASGFKGSLAANASDLGVFEGTFPGVSKPVAIKVYPETGPAATRWPQDLAGARAASRAGGPKFYGEVPAGPGKRAFAMEKIEGGFAENFSGAQKGSAEWARAEREARFYESAVTDRTATDVVKFGEKLAKRGYYYDGEVQGLITAEGRWRPIDFQSIERLPPRRDAAAYQEALTKHRANIEGEAAGYRKILADRAAGKTRP